MLIAMTVIGLTTYTLLLTSPHLLNSLAAQSSSPGHDHRCSDQERQSIWRQLPECIPRNTLVKVPLPLDPNIIQVTIHCILNIWITLDILFRLYRVKLRLPDVLAHVTLAMVCIRGAWQRPWPTPVSRWSMRRWWQGRRSWWRCAAGRRWRCTPPAGAGVTSSSAQIFRHLTTEHASAGAQTWGPGVSVWSSITRWEMNQYSDCRCGISPPSSTQNRYWGSNYIHHLKCPTKHNGKWPPQAIAKVEILSPQSVVSVMMMMI